MFGIGLLSDCETLISAYCWDVHISMHGDLLPNFHFTIIQMNHNSLTHKQATPILHTPHIDGSIEKKKRGKNYQFIQHSASFCNFSLHLFLMRSTATTIKFIKKSLNASTFPNGFSYICIWSALNILTKLMIILNIFDKLMWHSAMQNNITVHSA